MIAKMMRIMIRLTFRDCLGIIHAESIYKSRARIIYCRILGFTPEKTDSNPNVISLVCDLGTHAPDIGQTLPDSHYHGMCSDRRSIGNFNIVYGLATSVLLYGF